MKFIIRSASFPRWYYIGDGAWSTEYVDAQLYDEEPHARLAADNLAKQARLRSDVWPSGPKGPYEVVQVNKKKFDGAGVGLKVLLARAVQIDAIVSGIDMARATEINSKEWRLARIGDHRIQSTENLSESIVRAMIQAATKESP